MCSGLMETSEANGSKNVVFTDFIKDVSATNISICYISTDMISTEHASVWDIYVNIEQFGIDSDWSIK